jgi:hypothetical protein
LPNITPKQFQGLGLRVEVFFVIIFSKSISFELKKQDKRVAESLVNLQFKSN